MQPWPRRSRGSKRKRLLRNRKSNGVFAPSAKRHLSFRVEGACAREGPAVPLGTWPRLRPHDARYGWKPEGRRRFFAAPCYARQPARTSSRGNARIQAAPTHGRNWTRDSETGELVTRVMRRLFAASGACAETPGHAFRGERPNLSLRLRRDPRSSALGT
jgi:hypothetical protein